MPEKYTDFNKAELTHLEDMLKLQYEELGKKVEVLNGELRRIGEILNKIKKLRNGDRGVLSSINSGNLKQKLVLILEEGPLPTRDIRRKYYSYTGKEISRERVFDCLKKHQGMAFEVIGERGSAAWKLVNGNKDGT